MFVLVLTALMPLSASAASASSHRTPHFFLKSSLQHVSSNVALLRGRNMTYHSGPVMAGTANVYAIYWEPTNNVQSGYNSLIQQYFGDVNGSGLYKNNTQYTQTGGGNASATHFVASWIDTSAYPESPLLDSDIQNEVTHAQSVNGWSSSITNVFFVFLQKGENLCFDSTLSQCASNYFCAYHSSFGTNTLYAAMPYAASFSCQASGQTKPNNNDADLTINVTSHEQMEAATDPLGNAWYDSTGNEIGDKCAWTFGTKNAGGGDVTWNGHTYELQKEWDNHVTGCVMTGP